MGTSSIRHKHLRIDQEKLEKAKRLLDVKTDTEALDRALTLVVTEGEINETLQSMRGKAKLEKVYP